MSLVCRRVVTLALENMAQMSTTIGAGDFSPFHAMAEISLCGNGPGNPLIKRRPSTARIKLGGGFVKRRVASRTIVHPLGAELVVNARIWRLCGSLSKHCKLHGRKHRAPLIWTLWKRHYSFKHIVVKNSHLLVDLYKRSWQ